MPYTRRILDDELDELLTGLPAVAIEGPKGVGKTETASRRAVTIYRLDDPIQAELASADPVRLTGAETPILLDEWQRVPAVWDAVRRAVDDDPSPNRFLITGSASPATAPTHSGAGRIVRLRLRPLTLAERGLAPTTVSLAALLEGEGAAVEGDTDVRLARYAEEIVASGFPAIRPLPPRARRAQIDGYLARIVDRDFEDQGQQVRRPGTLRRWMRAYAAATSTTASLETIRDAATGGESEVPARSTVLTYRDILERLWILDPVPAWVPSRNPFARLTRPEKHHLADPALASALLGADVEGLLSGVTPHSPRVRDGALLGHLFESLVTLSVRVYAQRAESRVGHIRTKGGRQEIDLIVERRDGRVLAIEVKLAGTVRDKDARHLAWLRKKIGPDLIDAMIITTGPHAYRRADGIAVVPASLLGP